MDPAASAAPTLQFEQPLARSPPSLARGAGRTRNVRMTHSCQLSRILGGAGATPPTANPSPASSPPAWALAGSITHAALTLRRGVSGQSQETSDGMDNSERGLRKQRRAGSH